MVVLCVRMAISASNSQLATGLILSSTRTMPYSTFRLKRVAQNSQFCCSIQLAIMRISYFRWKGWYPLVNQANAKVKEAMQYLRSFDLLQCHCRSLPSYYLPNLQALVMDRFNSSGLEQAVCNIRACVQKKELGYLQPYRIACWLCCTGIFNQQKQFELQLALS